MSIWALMVLSLTLALGQARSPDITRRCWSLLNDAAQDKNPDVRKDAAEALSLVPVSVEVLQQLDSMLEDHDVAVRIAVITTLGDFKDRRGAPA